MRASCRFPVLLFIALILPVGWVEASSPPVSESSASTADERSEEPLTADNWPTTVAATVADILAALPEKDIETLRATPKDDLILFHHGWGTGIRNHYGLWRGNLALLQDACGAPECHPDDASMVIIEAVWNAAKAPRDDG